MRGRLIAVEGIDGCGKSTQARLLADSLGAVLTYQFGATDVGAVIRRVLLDPANHNLNVRAEALLIIADKAQHTAEIVEPELRAGNDVVTDRFTASTLAYQGYGRGLDLEDLSAMMHFATAGTSPDLNVLLRIDPEVAARRLGPTRDRFEEVGNGFMERVDLGYRSLADADPSRWAVIDASGTVDEVAARLQTTVRQRLEPPAFAGLC